VIQGLPGFAQLQIRARIAYESGHFEPVAHDARVPQQLALPLRTVARHLLGIEAIEGPTVILALAQDREPAQTGLSALETEHLEQSRVVVQGQAPFLVMVGDIERILGAPRAALLAVCMQHGSALRSVRRGRHGPRLRLPRRP